MPPAAPLSGATPEARESEAIGFVLDLGRALHRLGHPSHWLEEALDRASRRLALTGQFFTTPTSIFAAFGEQSRQRTWLLRVEPGELHLERLVRVVETGRDVLAGRLSPAQGSAAIRAILSSAPRYGAVVTALAFALSAAAAGRFLGGGVPEIVAASALGVVVSLVAALAERLPAIGRVFEPLAAFVVAALATAIARATPLAVYPTTVAAILVLLPGLAFTAAMAELSSQHLVSGTARLTWASVRFVALAFGVASGQRVAALLLGAPAVVTPVPPPGWTEWLALLLAPLAFCVLLRARPRDFPSMLAIGTTAFFAGRVAGQTFGAELGPLVGTFTAAALGNLLARRTGLPPQVTLVPAILLLVPGSVAFRGLALMLDREVLSGVDAAFRALVFVSAMVAGLLLASVVAPAPPLTAERDRPQRAARGASS